MINQTRLNALTYAAEYIIDCENSEYESYVTYCDELDLDPANIEGDKQKGHIYALALIGLGLKFPID